MRSVIFVGSCNFLFKLLLLSGCSRPVFAIAWATTILICLPGCVMVPRYPSRLPSLVSFDNKNDECPIITGRYVDKGDAFSIWGESLGQVSLTDLLSKGKSAAVKFGGHDLNIDSVVVIGPENDELEMQMSQVGNQLATMQRQKFTSENYYAKGGEWVDKGAYFCRKGFVEFHVDEWHDGGCLPPLCIVFSQNETLWLSKAEDGSLIAFKHRVNLGFVVLLPYWLWTDIWYRFPATGP